MDRNYDSYVVLEEILQLLRDRLPPSRSPSAIGEAGLEVLDQEEPDPGKVREALAREVARDPLFNAVYDVCARMDGCCMDDELDRFRLALAVRDAVVEHFGSDE